jgi:hypothetical protein
MVEATGRVMYVLPHQWRGTRRHGLDGVDEGTMKIIGIFIP